jgi:RHS repeat-associated protein
MAIREMNESEPDAPQAYLNAYWLNDSYDLASAQHKNARVTTAASITPTTLASAHERLQLEWVIEKPGYLYINVSHDAVENIDVYFDDLHIEHVYSPIVAGSDFYPFGLEMADRHLTREKYRYGYQGKFAEHDEETNWNHFELREYEPLIGRWNSRDPKKQYYSGYVGMGNNPINGVDPDGGKFLDWFVNQKSGEVLEAPGKDQSYAKELGGDWAWLAKDGAFSVPKSLNYNFGLFGGEYRTWSFEESVELMKVNNWSLSPISILKEEYVNMPVNQVTPSGPVSVTNTVSNEIWLKSTYIPEGTSASTRVRPIYSEDKIGGYYQVLKISNTYHKESSFWQFERGAQKTYNKFTQSGSNQNQSFINWNGYPSNGRLRNFSNK